ncbi:hypothetical protein FDECE_17273 [Fusarium decemcellulare]|nr:hypothetical protein FDECE_17273 [Fusarium decemcellulare]
MQTVPSRPVVWCLANPPPNPAPSPPRLDALLIPDEPLSTASKALTLGLATLLRHGPQRAPPLPLPTAAHSTTPSPVPPPPRDLLSPVISDLPCPRHNRHLPRSAAGSRRLSAPTPQPSFPSLETQSPPMDPG